MATKHDIRLVDLLLKRSKKWRDRFDGFEVGSKERLAGFFTDYEQNKRFLLLSFLDGMELGEGRVLVDGGGNRAALARALKEMRELNVTSFGPKSSFAKWVDRTYRKAALLGVQKTRDIFRLGESRPLPPGFRAPVEGLVAKARGNMFRHIAARNGSDINLIRQSVLRRIFDPTGTVQSLRRDLVNIGQVEGMVDTIGRRITASERADRIARFEFAELSTHTHQDMVNRIYNDGEPRPNVTFYLWQQIRDNRASSSHARRHGQVLSEAQWQKKDFGDGTFGLPPLRPRCRCNPTFVRPEWFSPKTRDRIFNSQIELPLTEAVAA